MKKGKSSKDSTQQTRKSSEATAGQSSHRPRGIGRFLKKVKDKLRTSIRISARRFSPSRSAVPPNVDHEHASSTSVQAAPSGCSRGCRGHAFTFETRDNRDLRSSRRTTGSR
ncbi:hypothetical protein DFJ58DRAFT_847843 [Suillus subalutaceus]|uniref:uncharacterized protein n=1 Tax=Suillus subalutaceus TaxID=48586 RepID=UPI001B87608F|nr:uncharacterized protein DFJ58DRAFT_847843 [Suillus subalutaceus]KAG1833250.1 hypothetical protein DFJ58DRAFT_847843 [Suillus subalutaceus]